MASRLRALPVRTRITAGVVVIVGAALVATALALVTTTRASWQKSVATAARLRAQDFVALLESGTRPDQLHIRLEEDVIVQVLDGEGKVVTSSPLPHTDRPIVTLETGESRIVEELPDEDDPFLVVAEPAMASGGDMLVLVGRNLDSVIEMTRTLTLILAVAVPILLVFVGVTAWLMVGRALAPVESIRQEVTEISATELHRRVLAPLGDDEIARLARTMNDMLQRLESARSRQQRLVSDASHELRNPVAAIRQHAETALRHPEQTTVSDLAEDVLVEDLRLQQLAEDLLLLAKADENGLRMELRPLDVDDLVLEEADRLRRTTRLRIDGSSISHARVMGDGAQLQRALRNLVDNAARHARSSVRLAVGETDGRMVLQIDDDGPGVPPDQREAVFERFTRLDEARGRAHGGAGLGLAIVATIVAAHRGRVTVGDSPFGGARFEVTLPLAPG